MTPKGWNLAVKDYFPTPLLKNENDEIKCWPGPGITVREHMAMEMLKALAAQQGILADTVEDGEAILAEKATKFADALIEYLANNEPERDTE